MTKLTDEEKAAKAEAAAAKKAEKEAEKEAKAEAAKKDMRIIQCTCSNVHLGNGNILRAERNHHGNWVKGDTAEVSSGVADMLEERGQVKIL